MATMGCDVEDLLEEGLGLLSNLDGIGLALDKFMSILALRCGSGDPLWNLSGSSAAVARFCSNCFCSLATLPLGKFLKE